MPPRPLRLPSAGCAPPDILAIDSFHLVIKKLARFVSEAIDSPSTFEQLRTTSAGDGIRILVDHLSSTCTNPAIVNALLVLKWHYSEGAGPRSVAVARADACEIVAWRFVARVTERESMEFCLYDLPDSATEGDLVTSPVAASARRLVAQGRQDIEANLQRTHAVSTSEFQPLLGRIRRAATISYLGSPIKARRIELLNSLSRLNAATVEDGLGDPDIACCSDEEEMELDDGGVVLSRRFHPAPDPGAAFKHLNALEIAAIANAKRFLSQPVAQRIITGIWDGDIIFWDRLTTGATKCPRFYAPSRAEENDHGLGYGIGRGIRHGIGIDSGIGNINGPGHDSSVVSTDPFSRLRVPKYLKCWEVIFFGLFMALYYTVLIEQNMNHFTLPEIGLYIWLAAFLFDKLSEWNDAGNVFFATDIWNIFDGIMTTIGILFAILRVIGISRHDSGIINAAFKVLALEALFMVPRLCSLLSLSPYWGILIPCLKEQAIDFLKYMVLVVIIYIGFLTTFCLVGRDNFSAREMTLHMTRIFYGSNYVGFDIMDRIDRFFGPPLMIVFVTLSSILLTGSLTGILSNSFSRVFAHANEEYLYVYSVYVLEAAVSNRLTYFYPPFNLLALLLSRPLRLILPTRHRRLQMARILLLKATHAPIVGVILLYEAMRRRRRRRRDEPFLPLRLKLGDVSSALGRSQSATASLGRLHCTALDNTPPSPGCASYRFSRPGFDDSRNAVLELRNVIDELTRKIDALTTAVMTMQTAPAPPLAS